VILFLGLVVVTILFTGATIPFFLNIPCLLLIILPVFFVLMPVYKISGFTRNLSAAFNGKGSEKELKQALQFTKHLSLCFHFSAGVGVLVGLIAMLALINDTNVIGAGLSLTLVVLLYDFLIQIILVLPMSASLKKKINDLE
jgi:flagellar motor component MotA